MKNRIFPKLPAILVGVVLLGGLASPVSAQLLAPAPAAAAPTLPFGASEVLKLVHAKVGDETVVAYINHTPIGFNLSAADLIYLRGEGVSDSVMSAMLKHARPAESTSLAAAPAPYSSPAPAAPAVTPGPVVVQAAPTTTYVQAPPVVVSAPPVVYDYGYYPYYGYGYGYGYRYPAVSLSFGFGGRGYYRGGYYGGYHGGFRGHR